MAVLPEWRGRGVGDAMLSRLLDLAIELGYPRIELHSQVHAMPFYARAGFEAEGPEYIEAGIPHRNMSRLLPARSTPERRPLPQSQEHALESRDACRDAALALLRQARHRLWIFSHDLDPELLCTSEALAELRRVAVSGRQAQIRIIVQDTGAALRPAAQLIHLAQRASSTLEIRAPTDEVDLNFPAAFLLDDTGGYLFRPIGSQFEGTTHRHGAGRNRQLRQLFDQIWERSLVPTELRALKL